MDADYLTNFSAFNCVSLEVSIFSCGLMNVSDTILSTNSNVRKVKDTLHIIMVHKETLSGRQLDKTRYFSNKMSGVSATIFPLTPFHS